MSAVPSGSTVSVIDCTKDRPSTAALALPSTILYGLDQTVTQWSYTIFAPMIDIRWKSSDRTALPTDTLTVTPKLATDISKHAASYDSHTLSAGSIAAISVVVPLVTIAALIVVGYFFRRQTRRSRESAQQTYSMNRDISNPISETVTDRSVRPGQDSDSHAQELVSPMVDYKVAGTLRSGTPFEPSPVYEAEDTSANNIHRKV